jgi:hypothetical protein
MSVQEQQVGNKALATVPSYSAIKPQLDWKSGRFSPVPGETDFIPLPEPI